MSNPLTLLHKRRKSNLWNQQRIKAIQVPLHSWRKAGQSVCLGTGSLIVHTAWCLSHLWITGKWPPAHVPGSNHGLALRIIPYMDHSQRVVCIRLSQVWQSLSYKVLQNHSSKLHSSKASSYCLVLPPPQAHRDLSLLVHHSLLKILKRK